MVKAVQLVWKCLQTLRKVCEDGSESERFLVLALSSFVVQPPCPSRNECSGR